MVSISLDRGSIAIRAPYDPSGRLQDFFKSIQGWKWCRRTKRWLYPATRNSAHQIREAFELSPYLMPPSEDLERLLNGVAIPHTTQIPLTADSPWEHQKAAFWFAVNLWGGLTNKPCGGAMLALGMGCGKTRITIDLIQNYKFMRTLVICPAKVIAVWPKQFKLWCKWNGLRVLPLDKGPIKKRAEQLQTIHLSSKDVPLVAITNYEATRATNSYDALNKLIKLIPWDLVVIDESHRIKSPGGKDSKFFASFGTKIPCRLGLTGTPMSHGAIDLYAQCRFLDPSVFGTSNARFKARYAVLGGFDGLQVVGYQNCDELTERFAKIALQIRAEDVFPDLPSENHIERPVELDVSSRDHYNSLDEDFMTWLDSEKNVTVQNALVKLLKLQELTGGFLRDPDLGDIHRFGFEKVEVVKDILEDLDEKEPIVIACRFTPDIQTLKRELTKKRAGNRPGWTCSELSGRKNELENWQQGETKVLLCQIESGKEGIDLTRAHYAILYSIGFSYITYHQFLRRFRRPGQESNVCNYLHLVAQNTVDQQVYASVLKKQNVVEAILKEVRAKGEPTGRDQGPLVEKRERNDGRNDSTQSDNAPW